MALPEAHKQAIAPCPMRDTQRPFRVLTGCLLLLTCGVLLLRQAGNNSGQGTETTSIRIKQAAVSTKKSQMAQQQEEITIVAFSDSHGLHLRPSKLAVPTEGQVLLIAGDLGLEDDRDVEQFEKFLEGMPQPHKAMTWGNMDMWAEPQRGAAQPPRPIKGITTIKDAVVEVAGLRILGSPWTPKYYGAYQLANEAAAEAHWSSLLTPSTRIDVLITHGPPHGYGDAARGKHVGDKALLKAVQAMEVPPKLWLCGHIHEGRGTYQVPHPKGDILLVNVGVAYAARGEAEHQPFIIKLPSRTVLVGPPPAAQERGLQEVWKAPTHNPNDPCCVQ